MHCLFILQDIGCHYVDEFVNLPTNRVYGTVHACQDEAYARFAAFFYMTH